MVFAKKYLKPVALFQWCDSRVVSRRTRYEVAVGTGSEVNLNELFFDPARQQWSLEPVRVVLL